MSRYESGEAHNVSVGTQAVCIRKGYIQGRKSECPQDANNSPEAEEGSRRLRESLEMDGNGERHR